MVFSLAPMAALSHAGLRRLIDDFLAPDEYFSEMIHAPSLISGNQFEKWYLRACPTPEKLVWQITTPNQNAGVKAIPMLLENGGMGVDLNMGCCAPQIVNQGAGFGWMLKPVLETANYVKAIKSEIIKFSNTQPVRLSVKIRLGQSEDYNFLLSFCKILVGEGVDLITLHPRLQRQSYLQPAKHKYINMLSKDINIPVYGNGDIDSYTKFENTKEKIQCTGWMIGRSAVQKPWIFYELKNKQPPHNIDLLQVVIKFLDYLEAEQPPEFQKTRRQRFFAYFANNFKFAHYLKNRLLKAKNRSEIMQEFTDYFSQSPSEQFLK
ncbi:MAG: dihydrouridine synthase [Treponema sp.]|nr:MAG: dihydrouridine synthase [Treponema sp.]